MSEQINKPGYYRGKHYTEYVPKVKRLKQAGKLEEAEKLLMALVEANEAENEIENRGVAPWYYLELAKIYRKLKNPHNEVMILERFAYQKHAPGTMPPKLLDRLEKAKALLAKQN